MSTPFLSDYLPVVAATADIPANPTSDPGTSPEMIAFCFDAETQTLTMWDPVNEERLTISFGGAGAVDAGDVTYDNGSSGLAATDVQAAIDELASTPGGPSTTDDLSEGASNLYHTVERAQDAVGLMVDVSLTYVDGTPLLQRAALTGDVTASAGSNATTIAAGSVTPAKLSFSGAMVKKSVDLTGQNMTAGVDLSFDAEVYDVGGWHDNVTANTKLIVPAGVTYVQVGATVGVANLTVDDFIVLQIFKGGVGFDGMPVHVTEAGNSAMRISVCSGPIAVVAGNEFTCNFAVQSDTSVDITASRTNFWIRALA